MTTVDHSSPSAHALAAAERGWHVFPLRRGDKRPALHREERCPQAGVCASGHVGWEPRATTDPERIARCWESGEYNVGIATGPSGLLVIDLDIPKPGGKPAPPEWQVPGVVTGEDVLAMLCERAGEPLPFDTHTVRTPTGGRHLFFAAPPSVQLRNTAGSLGWLIDTRAHGGYVVAAGSVVEGKPYITEYDAVPAPLPGWIAERLATKASERANAATLARLGTLVGRRSGYATAALRGEVDRVLTAREGSRNHTLNAAAYALGQLTAAGLLPRSLAEEALTIAGQSIGLPPRECAATIRSGLNSGEAMPRKVSA